MPHHTLESDLPWIDVPGEFTFLFEAIDPTTGAPVTGVNFTNIAIFGEPLTGGGLGERIIPTLTPDEIEGLNG